MKTKFWNGSFLRTVLQCLAIACAALLALSALGAGLVARRCDRSKADLDGGLLH